MNEIKRWHNNIQICRCTLKPFLQTKAEKIPSITTELQPLSKDSFLMPGIQKDLPSKHTKLLIKKIPNFRQQMFTYRKNSGKTEGSKKGMKGG